MLQIFFNPATGGPQKVISNLLSGLKLLHANYICNPLDIETKDPAVCLNNHHILSSELIEHLTIGPNICVLPIDNAVVMGQRYKKNIVPCNWVKDKYKRFLPESILEVWPVGIDTKEFSEVTKSSDQLFDCLIYFKSRSPEELNFVTSLLDSFNQKYALVQYGNYSEDNFKKIIKNSKYCFSLDDTESQGIALQEIMSSNLPMFVWDVDKWTYRGPEYECPATSVPYWDPMCGEKTSIKEEIKDKFHMFINNLNNYTPRQFILDNLNLEKQAQELINIV